MLKLKMMLCVMMCCRWSSSVAHQSGQHRSVREATTASGVDNAASHLADTAERDYFTLREADHYAKTLEGTRVC